MEEKNENGNINGDNTANTDNAMNVNCNTNRVSMDSTLSDTAMNCNHGNGINGNGLEAERVAILDAGAQYGKVTIYCLIYSAIFAN